MATKGKPGQLEYNTDTIERFAGLVGVRKKLSVYIGSTDSHGMFTILREVLDNTIDEFLAGRNTQCTVVMDEDGSFWVTDSGTGIPVGIKEFHNEHGKAEKLNTLYVVTGLTHGGGKMTAGGAYETSRGVHGIGTKATNAASEYYHVMTKYKNTWSEIRYEEGVLKTDVREAKKAPTVPHVGPVKSGTVIHFKPDLSCFDKNSKFPMKELLSWSEMAAFLNGGFRITLINKDGKRKEYYSKEGSLDLLKKMIEISKAEPLEGKSVYVLATKPEVDLAVAFTDYDGTKLDGFTNGLHNPHGGVHVDQFYIALNKTIAPYRNTKHKFGISELKEGIIGIVNVKLASPKFKTQTKEELIDLRAEEPTLKVCSDALTKFFSENKALARRLCDRATELRGMKNEFLDNKKALRELKAASTSRSALPPKLAMAIKCRPEDRELYIIEGDSARGTACMARDSAFQEVLPLKGKILNVMRTKKSDRAFENEEVMGILKSIGFVPDVADPMSKLRVGKIILTADADVDGPVVGDTRVLLLDGTNPTIEELALKWKQDNRPFWVYSRDSTGRLVPALAESPKIATVVSKMASLTLDNGCKIRCSVDHKWLINDPDEYDSRVVWYKGNGFLRTKHLSPGDSINSVYLSKVKSRTSDLHYTIIHDEWSCERKRMPVHQWIKSVLEPKKFKKYRSKNKGVTGGAVHIHHKDGNAQNNSPDNLEFITKEKHFAHHGGDMSYAYNGSQKQKNNLKKFFSSEKGEQFVVAATGHLVDYNKSDVHRELVCEMNTDESQIRLQSLGRISRHYLSLVSNSLEVCAVNWDNFLVTCVPKWCNLIDNFTLYEVTQFIETHNLTQDDAYPLVEREKQSYPTQFVSKFLVVALEVLNSGKRLNETSYEATRSERGVRGDPKYPTIMERMNFADNQQLVAFVKNSRRNHIVTSVVIEDCDPTPVYCLTVPETGNFMFDDGRGNGICSSNSHINALILGCLYRYVPGVFSKSMVYIAQGAEFIAETPDGNFYGDTLEEVRAQCPSKYHGYILHLKGWGECSADGFSELAFNPRTRVLKKILPFDSSGETRFKALMMENVSYRYNLLGLS